MCARLTLVFYLIVIPSFAADWPQFRGPQGDGAAGDSASYPTEWGPDKNIKWQAKLPAPGNSSPIVSNGRVFVTCAENDGTKRSLFCFDRQDGKQLWVRSVEAKKMPTHKTNPYCGASPVADGERVVVWHATAGLHCYDYEGNKLWSRDLGEVRHDWGYGSSPIMHNGNVVLFVGPAKESYMTMIDAKTGETIWQTPEPEGGVLGPRTRRGYVGAWGTPVIAEHDGKELILFAHPTRLAAYDPTSGTIAWYCNGLRGDRGDLAYSSPLVGDGIAVVQSGFKGPAIAVKLGGEGDVTATHRLWRETKSAQNIGSGIFLDGHIYKVNAGPGTIQCLLAKTGEEKWNERGGTFWGSIVLADGKMYATNQNGATVVFRPSPDGFEEIAENRLNEPSNSTPAFSDGEIFLRTFHHLYCVDDS